MGSWFSSNKPNTEQSQVKGVDSTGVVNNNLQLEGPIDIHSLEIIVLLSVITILKIVEFIFFLYAQHQRKHKKRMTALVNAHSRLNLNNINNPA